MLKDPDTQVSASKAPRHGGEAFQPVEIVAGNHDTGLLILCDHASAEIPAEYGDLGVENAVRARHIAYDIGARSLALALAKCLNAPALMTRYSRLVIDPNRGEDDPTLIMRISDRATIAGNADVDEAERLHRLNVYYRPYHQAIDDKIDEMTIDGRMPMLLSLHSFTHSWRGVDRPWHAGILWDRDPRLAKPLIEKLAGDENLVIGDNEPYKGWLKGDTMYRHGTKRGIAHGLVEVRQDLISNPVGVAEWADRIARVMRIIMKAENLREKKCYGSQADS